MTEAELIESVQLVVGNAFAAYAIFLTLATSYVVIAQISGRNLSPSQVGLLTTLYSIAIAIMVGALQGQNILSDSLRLEQLERFPRGGEVDIAFAPITLASNLLIYLGSLKYMWDIRRKWKQDDA